MSEIRLRLPDGSERRVPAGITGQGVAEKIGSRLAKDALAIKIDGRLQDLNLPVEHDASIAILTFDSNEGHEVYWHSTSHLMAHAVKQLFPQAKLAIGPAIEEGFYYDFDLERPFAPEDLEKIEKKMTELAKAATPITRKDISKADALAFFNNRGESYKAELISELPDEAISIYEQGDFADLCRGPHVPSTARIKAFKLLSIAGAYWRGSEKNKMLQRIYGISFPNKEALDEYVTRLEEIKRRDHRKLGKDLDLFSISEESGGGLVLWHPKGALIRKTIEDFWRDEHLKSGYDFVYSPHVGRGSLWETSGHLGFYRENMYSSMDIEGQEYYVKPMNCPFHIMIYKNKLRSYRELPLRYAELGTVYRFERSGVLHGLLRVRGFTQDDAHIFVAPEDMETEVVTVLAFVVKMLRTFGFDDFKAYVATRPEKSVGENSRWEQATQALKVAAEKVGLSYEIDEGGGAFYGPKIDIKIKDALGRLWQCSTVQFDFNMSERFDMTFVGVDNQAHRPYMIHRALLGSIERFFGMLIEHYAGAFPVWLAPVQAKVLSISDKQFDYAKGVRDRLRAAGIRAELDPRSEKIGFKIREAAMEKVPYILVVGDKEIEQKTVAVRERGGKDLGAMPLDDFINRVTDIIAGKSMTTELTRG
ncbi:MAG: threonine--tRNA ligase [Nitrospirae bacterium]|nr:threonine--tRNA ligase [Nitrospirota bacterium]NTW65890.1 threonine--tRNA ligase [Nitrospirota bacterium]